MQNEEKLDKILEKFYVRFNKYNTKILEELGNTIKLFDGLTPSEAHKLGQELKYSNNINDLLKELSRLSGKSIKDINTLLDEVAKENLEFAEAYNVEYTDQIRRYVDAVKQQTYGTFKDLSKSKNLGFSYKDKNGKMIFKPFKKVYTDLIDEAVYNASSGVVDYQSAMRNTIKQLADSGIKVHEAKTTYKTGYTRRIDTSVRQAILTGIRKINLGVQERVGEQFGADGYEISAHFPCAEDHLDIQGRQYTKEEYKELNEDLTRPIGELNCTHFAFAIIIGVNLPSYSNKQLREYREKSLEEITYNGKTYTKYQATQVQRRLETEIRKQKDRQIMARASGNKAEISDAQRRISQLTNEYNRFSQIAGLDTYKNRLAVSGYNRLKSYDKS